jgi:hypothetical protein
MKENVVKTRATFVRSMLAVAIAGVTGGALAADEPIQPLRPVQEINLAQVELGKKFTPEENAMIVAFLKTLTGDQPHFLMPILPPSTDKTPPPKPFG